MILKYDPRAPQKATSTVATIQEWLNFLGFKCKNSDGTFEPLQVTGIYDEKTESVVTLFQASESVYADGIVGPVTMKVLEKAYSNRVLELNSPGVDAMEAPNRYTLDRVYADPYEQGYTKLFMRMDAASAYRAVRNEAINCGAILTSSGTMRSLNAEVTQSRSAVSFHYLGLALDLYIYSGMTNPERDAYVVVEDGERLHRVFARCSDKWTFNSEYKPISITLPPERELKNIVTYKQRKASKNPTVKGNFLDLTETFEKNGFRRIRARRNFYDGNSMMGAEWWHFQYESGLLPHVSTFGNELLKIYSKEKVNGTGPWQQRNRIFMENWF